MIVFSSCDEIEHHCRNKFNESCTKFLVLSLNNTLASSTKSGNIKLQQASAWAPHSSYEHHIISSDSILISNEIKEKYHSACIQSKFTYCQNTKKIIVGSWFNTPDALDLSTLV